MKTETVLPLFNDKSIKIKWGKSTSEVTLDNLKVCLANGQIELLLTCIMEKIIFKMLGNKQFFFLQPMGSETVFM